MPKSGISALMAMATIRDHSANIFYGTRVMKRSFAEWTKYWVNVDATSDRLQPGAIVLPAKVTTTVSNICSNDERTQFKAITCYYGPLQRVSAVFQVGERGTNELFKYSMLIDTGASNTWVWTNRTRFYLVEKL